MRPSTHNQNRQTAARVSWLLVTYPVTLLLVNGSCLQHLRRHSRPFALHKQIRIVYKIMIAFERFYVWSEHEKSARLWVGSGGLGVSPCVCVCVAEVFFYFSVRLLFSFSGINTETDSFVGQWVSCMEGSSWKLIAGFPKVVCPRHANSDDRRLHTQTRFLGQC